MRYLIITAAVLAAALPASAQEHDGFWIGFGIGGGVNVAKGLDGEQLGGGGGYFRLGGTPDPHVLLGGELIGWGRERFNQTLGRGNGTFIVMLYPDPDAGAYVKIGVGGATVTTTEDFGATTITTTTNGFGATAGLGFEVPLGRMHLSPNVDWLFQAFDADQFPFLAAATSTNSILLVTIGLIWH